MMTTGPFTKDPSGLKIAAEENPDVKVPGCSTLDNVKAEIRSVMVISPSKLISLNELLKDYEQAAGTKLPYREFGYDSPMQFFQSLPDVVKIVDGDKLSLVGTEQPKQIDTVKNYKQSNWTAPAVQKPPPWVYAPQPPNAYPHLYPQQFVAMPMQAPLYPFYANPPQRFAPPLSMPRFREPMIVPPFNNWLMPQTTFSSWPCPPYPFNAHQGASLHKPPALIPPPASNSADGKNQETKPLPAADPPVVNSEEFKLVEGDAEVALKSEEGKYSDYEQIQKSDWIPVTVKIRGSVSSRPDSTGESDQKLVLSKSDGLPKYDCVVNQKSGSMTIRKRAELRIPFKSNTLANDDSTDDFLSANGSDATLMFPKDGLAKANHGTTLTQSVEQEVQAVENEDLPPPAPQQGLTEEMRANIKSLLSQNPNGIAADLFVSLYEELFAKPLDFTSCGYSNVKDLIINNEDLILFSKTKCSSSWTLFDVETSRILMRKRPPVPTSKWIPYSVTDNMAKLANKFKDGIEAEKMLPLYKEEFGTEIILEDIGFDSIEEFFQACRSVKFITFGDRKLIYPSGWLKDRTTTQQAELLKEPACPPVEKKDHIWRAIFKDHECDPSFKYSPPVVKPGLIQCVKLVDVFSPASFFIQFVDNIKKLKKLMHDLHSFYKKEHEVYRLDKSWVMPGLAVAALFGTKWHRAVVTGVHGETIGLSYVDYGTVSTATLSDVRKLDRRFSEDPMYAVNASMYCLIPPNSETWSAESYNFLYNNYGNQLLYAEIFNIDFKVPTVEVVLYYTSISEEINVNDQLVKKGLAAYAVDPALVMSQNLVSRIGGFLPWWFRYSDTSKSEPIAFVENFRRCSSNASDELNPEDRPCCLLDVVLQIFRANPNVLSEVWTNGILSVADYLVRFVVANVGGIVDGFDWDECLRKGPTFCGKHDPTNTPKEHPPDCIEDETICEDNQIIENHCSLADDNRSYGKYPDTNCLVAVDDFDQHAVESTQTQRIPTPNISQYGDSTPLFTTSVKSGEEPIKKLSRYTRSSSNAKNSPVVPNGVSSGKSDNRNGSVVSKQDSLVDRVEERHFQKGSTDFKPSPHNQTSDSSSLKRRYRRPPSQPHVNLGGDEWKTSSRNDMNDERNQIFNGRGDAESRISPELSQTSRRLDKTYESQPGATRKYFPRVIHHIQIQILGCDLIIFNYKEELWVSISQLLLIPRITPLLVEYRLANTTKFIESIKAVSKDVEPELYEDLLDLGLVSSEDDELSDPLLVLLDEAAEVLNVVDPLVDYSKVLSLLFQKILYLVRADDTERFD